MDQVRLVVLYISSFAMCWTGQLQAAIADFSSDQWNVQRGSVGEHLGEKCLIGMAELKDVAFENGVIEVDVAFDGSRCFAGIFFRKVSDGDYENFYLRPHNTNKPTALQYTPEFNGLSGWQLYNGEGFTAQATIPYDQWIHVKLEVSGTQARVFLNHEEQPSLVVRELKRGLSRGSIGVAGPAGGQAYFANFSYEVRDDLEFPPPAEQDHPEGLVKDWEISQPFRYVDVDLEMNPEEQGLTDLTWQKVEPEPSGLVNIGRFTGLKDGQPSAIFARTTLEAEEDEPREINFGYSDAAVIFLNGQRLFTGVSTFRSRDATFLGVAGLYDTLVLPLKKGKNELLFTVVETFGGWGFLCQDGDYVFQDARVKTGWELSKQFNMPESVAYDAKRDLFYVSNYGPYSPPGTQFISTVTPDGKVKKRNWAQELARPTGAAVYQDSLFVVERRNIAELSLESGSVQKRYPIPDPGFVNDLTVDKDGTVYASDSMKHQIYRLAEGTMEIWLSGDEVQMPNGVLAVDNKLIWANNGSHDLKCSDLKTKEITTVAHVGPGGMDGIACDKDGNYLVTQYTGRLLLITPSGKVTKLLDVSATGLDLCDFAYNPEKNQIVIPCLRGNKLMAYELD